MSSDVQLYWKHSEREVEWFISFMDRHRDLSFFQPSPEKAPWHVQCKLDNGVLVNFWPHAFKAMIQDCPPTVSGAEADDLIADAKTWREEVVLED